MCLAHAGATNNEAGKIIVASSQIMDADGTN